MRYGKRETTTPNVNVKRMAGLRWLPAVLVVLTISALASGWGGVVGATPTTVDTDGTVAHHYILPGAEIRAEGTVTSILGDIWNIAGLTVRVNAFTRIDGNPTVGSLVEIDGWRLMDGAVMAWRIRNLAASSGLSGSGG